MCKFKVDPTMLLLFLDKVKTCVGKRPEFFMPAWKPIVGCDSSQQRERHTHDIAPPDDEPWLLARLPTYPGRLSAV